MKVALTYTVWLEADEEKADAIEDALKEAAKKFDTNCDVQETDREEVEEDEEDEEE